MLKGKRQFVPEVTRSGGRPSKVQFTIRCSECSETATFESKGLVSDDAVGHWFRQKGWLLGRNSRSFDICPACLGLADGNAAAQRPVPDAGSRIVSSGALVKKSSLMSKPENETDRLIARHFGKSRQTRQDPAPSRPDPLTTPDPVTLSGSAPHPGTADPPAQPTNNRSVHRVLASIGSDIESLRAAVFVMVEQVGRIVSMQLEQTALHKEAVAAQKQQIEAVARLAPLLVRSAEGVSGSVREALAGIRTSVDGPTAPEEATTERSDARDAAGAIAAVKRPRGRPRKHPLPETGSGIDMASAPGPVAAKRPRGRPPKLPISDSNAQPQAPRAAASRSGLMTPVRARIDTVAEPAIETKRPRGRPRKHPRPDELVRSPVAAIRTVAATEPAPAVRRPRGRPRKHPVTNTAARRVTPDPAAKPATPGASDARVNWEKKAWSRHVSVASQPDRSSSTKFTTVIQIKRKDWDLSGFRAGDGLAIERSRNEVMITRAASGGVRATRVGATRVEIRAKTLGNLNFSKVKLDAIADTIVLKGSRL